MPIVGIGASAGGLRALERFLAPVPANATEAFVVVQHLAPDRTPMLVELLQHSSALPVEEITDGTVVKAGHVYVIPPGHELTILDGVLLLLEPVVARGQRLTIDGFFKALAKDVGDRAIGVLLSGMGADGVQGLRAIQAVGGATFVQQPESAEYASMPRQAVAAEAADVVATPDALYEAIVAQLRQRPASDPPAAALPGLAADEAPIADADDDADLTDPELDPAIRAVGPEAAAAIAAGLDKVMSLVRAQTGHDFSQYKRSTLTRRVARRMHASGATALADYVRLLQRTPAEADALFRDLLIGVTRFFRDAAAWGDIASRAIPSLLARHPAGAALRAWVPGCSTGEEAYSLAIVFREALLRLRPSAEYTLQIFATDLDADAVSRGRTGVYPPSIAADVSPERLRRYFEADERGFRLTRQIREMVLFAPHNLVMDPPFTRLDLICCRNVLIYFTAPLQRRLLPLFHYALRPGGLLFLGSAESVGSAAPLFTPLSEPSRIYQRVDAPVELRNLAFPGDLTRLTPPSTPPPLPDPSPDAAALRREMEQRILERVSPTALLVDAGGRVLHTVGDPDRVLGVPPQRSAADDGSWLAKSPAPIARAILTALPQVPASSTPTRVMAEPAADGDAETPALRAVAEISALPSSADRRPHYLVLLLEEFAADPTDAASGPLSRALSETAQALARARRETDTSQQELRTANEELQSTNEELTTSKEEMQSMNEELQTVNHELQAKLDELTLASSDMANLLNSTSIATLFLDSELLVRRFTTPTTSIIRLIPGDVGRPITDLVSSLDFPEMAVVARDVLRTLVVFEREVRATDGRWFVVRIMPYRTHDDRIDGLVMTFTDVTKAKNLEAALRGAHDALAERLATADPAQQPIPPPDLPE